MSIFLYEKRFVSLRTSWVLKSLVVAVALSTSVVTTAANSNQNLAENTQSQQVQNVLTFEQVLDQVKPNFRLKQEFGKLNKILPKAISNRASYGKTRRFLYSKRVLNLGKIRN